MRKAEKLIRYIFLMILMFGTLFVVNLAIYVTPALSSERKYQHKAGLVALEKSLHKKNGQYGLDQEMEDILKEQNEFAMLIDKEGKVIWSYRLPDEIPREYDLKDVASFTRWYLKDYPVFTRITKEGILVRGMPKGSIWKYMLIENMDELSVRLRRLPAVLAIDLVALILLPFYILRRRMKKEEDERTEWIAGVSHDIRTPLSLVLGNADRILGEEVPEKIEENVHTIKNQAIYMKELVANLNTENRLSHRVGQWKKDQVILADLIRDVFCDILNQNEDSLYDVSCEIEESLEKVSVYADENLLRRMIENLLGNAIRHNPSGCGICVKLVPSPKSFLKQRYCLIVEDNGKGADSKTIKRLNGKSGKTKIAEHGLGLRVVKQIAKLYHWKIKFISERGEGFRCEVEIK